MASEVREVDVVIIGAGHNGLTAACYLARAGLDVAVVEAAPIVGGMTSTAHPFAEAPQHAVNTCAVDMVFLNGSPVLGELGLSNFGYRQVDPDPPYAYLHPDGSSFIMKKSVQATADDVARFSRRDAGRYVDLMRALDAGLQIALPLMRQNITRPSARSLLQVGGAVLRNIRHIKPFGKVVAESGLSTVLENFESPVIQGALAGLGGFVNPLDEDASGLNHFLIAGVHRFGVSRPVGGTGALPAALVKRLNASGGCVLTSWPVQEITVEAGRATGVISGDGKEIRARRAIVAACDPRRALLELLPAGHLDRISQIRAEAIPASAFGVGPFKIDIALKGTLRVRNPHPHANLRQPTVMWGTVEQVRDGYAAARSGRLPSFIPMITAIANAADPTQTPAGQDSLYVYAGAVPTNPPEGWDALRERTVAQLLSQVRDVYDGLDEYEIARRVLTPDDYGKYASNGCILHVDTGLFRAMGPARPAPGMAGYRAPIPGLWLTGIGTHPGGGVSGLPGRNAALSLIESLAGEEDQTRARLRLRTSRVVSAGQSSAPRPDADLIGGSRR